MSLKANIEAVIYAAEEPVTLPQLIGLLGEQAQAELEEHAAAAEQTQHPLTLVPDAQPEDAATETTPEPPSEETAAQAASDKLAAEKLAARRLREHFRAVLDQLIAEYATDERGLEIREVGGGFRFATKPQYHDAVRGFVKSLKPPMKLTLQSLETLAVIAYKQPVTAPEVSEIRGVDSGGAIGSLLARKLVSTAGRKQVIGRPILYKTTKDFLVRFGLKDISELPSIEEFEKMAGELNEMVQDELPVDAVRDIAEEAGPAEAIA